MDVHRNAPTIILHRHAAIDVDRHAHVLGIPSHAFVDRVVDHLVDKVMEAAGGVVADVHPKPLADMVAVGEVLEIGRRVVGLGRFVAHRVAPRSGREGSMPPDDRLLVRMMPPNRRGGSEGR